MSVNINGNQGMVKGLYVVPNVKHRIGTGVRNERLDSIKKRVF